MFVRHGHRGSSRLVFQKRPFAEKLSPGQGFENRFFAHLVCCFANASPLRDDEERLALIALLADNVAILEAMFVHAVDERLLLTVQQRFEKRNLPIEVQLATEWPMGVNANSDSMFDSVRSSTSDCQIGNLIDKRDELCSCGAALFTEHTLQVIPHNA